MNEYEQLKAVGLSDHNIKMLRNTGASFKTILAFGKKLMDAKKDGKP